MTDSQYIKRIATMDMPSLLREILNNPEYLTDPYYSDFRKALTTRGEELLK